MKTPTPNQVPAILLIAASVWAQSGPYRALDVIVAVVAWYATESKD